MISVIPLLRVFYYLITAFLQLAVVGEAYWTISRIF
jgi:hypothetical protein